MSNLHSAPQGQDLSPSRGVPVEAVLAHLSHVTASRTFENTPVLRQLLEHLVTRTVSGQADQLKEYSLGTDVFGRGASFDPRADTIVRVQARRLRSKLAEYYEREGERDPVVIDLPKGHYVPAFRARGDAVREQGSNDPSRPWSRWWVGLVPGVLIGAALTFVLRDVPESIAGNDVVSLAATTAPALPRMTKVRVSPFENHTGKPAMESIGRRAAEQIMAGMATLEDVVVGSRPAVSTGVDPDADLAIVGAYYGDDDALEFHARIVEARSGRLLHGVTTHARAAADLTAALDSLRQSVAGAVAAHQDEFFGGLDVISHPPTLEAYREYRAGLEFFQSDYTRALAHLQRSHDLAPNFLPPLVVLIFAHGNLRQPEKGDVLLAAIQEDSDHHTRAERLLVEFMRSTREGRREQARRLLEELEKLAPDSLLVNHNLVEEYLAANRPYAAVATYLRQPVVGKNLRHSVGSYRRWRFLQALHMLGAYDRELEESRRAQVDTPGVLVFVESEVRALAALGRTAEIDNIVERSESLPRTIGWIELPGDLMQHTAGELRAHGHRSEATAMAAKAVEWYRTRQAQAGAQRDYREGLARSLYLAERWADAAAIFHELVAEHPTDLQYRAWLGRVAAHRGDAFEARKISDELERMAQPIERSWAASVRANIAAALGEHERALQLLKDAFTEGMPYGPWLHRNPDFESMNDYEPYQRLLRPVG